MQARRFAKSVLGDCGAAQQKVIQIGPSCLHWRRPTTQAERVFLPEHPSERTDEGAAARLARALRAGGPMLTPNDIQQAWDLFAAQNARKPGQPG